MHVLEGTGTFLLEGRELPMGAGDLLVAPSGVPHGVRKRAPAGCSCWLFGPRPVAAKPF